MSNAKSTHHSKAVRGHHLGDRIVVPCRTHTKAGGFGDLSQERTLLPEKLRAAGLLFHSALAVGRWACEWGHQSSEAHVITKKQFFFFLAASQLCNLVILCFIFMSPQSYSRLQWNKFINWLFPNLVLCWIFVRNGYWILRLFSASIYKKKKGFLF